MKVNINDDYIDIMLKEIVHRLSNIQDFLLILSTIITSLTVYFHNSFVSISIYTIILVNIFLFIIYVYLENKKNIYSEPFTVKTEKVYLCKNKLFSKKICILGYKGRINVDNKDYDLIDKDTLGYAVISLKSNHIILWYICDKYEYKKILI